MHLMVELRKRYITIYRDNNQISSSTKNPSLCILIWAQLRSTMYWTLISTKTKNYLIKSSESSPNQRINHQPTTLLLNGIKAQARQNKSKGLAIANNLIRRQPVNPKRLICTIKTKRLICTIKTKRKSSQQL